tara:strand:- start:443 stop:811 length:369 start_codon:yes stop_codon:yes gene_type:complete
MFLKRKRIKLDLNDIRRSNKRKIEEKLEINKRKKLESNIVSIKNFQDLYTEFVYDLSNGLSLRKFKLNDLNKYIESTFYDKSTNLINNSKYLSKYNNNFNEEVLVYEEELWNFFEDELNFKR